MRISKFMPTDTTRTNRIARLGCCAIVVVVVATLFGGVVAVVNGQ